MAKIIKIGVAEKNDQEIKEVNSIEVFLGKGIVGDRHFSEYNDPYNQITLIESENIDYYNFKYKLNIPYKNFRRNIVTKDIKLNDLIGKKLKISNVILKAIDLCRPCKHLQKRLNQDNLIKEFLRKGGLRCEILSSGKINVNDEINF